ncbi:MAG: hypothetical protein HRU69_04915 [Flammeovirgaceae bacterium]|nr:MAG: hypothetical protein HRU69_04915 [Flammeovirgaceae bacterium]
MRLSQRFFLVLLSAAFSCNPGDGEAPSVLSLSYDFAQTDHGWTGDFADYPEGDSVTYELVFKHDTLPTNLNNNGTLKALMISGNNLSDDLFMFIKKKIAGLRPNTVYHILFNVRLASNAPTDAVGIGGAPGESVILKAGLTLTEPLKILDDDSYYRMNVDKGNQLLEGEDVINLGHIGVATNTTQYTTIFRNNNSGFPFQFTSDETGETWVLIGTDSGFEGKTTLYYTKIDILFNEVGPK